MKREIKFRAWDKVHKCWDNDFAIHADGCLYQPSRRRWDISDIAIETAYDDLELMQFTGLKDKNGKEIYEGDIVHVINVMKSKRPYNTDIYYDAPQFKLRVNHTYLYDFAAMRGTEIIGNIYENPELLNQKI